MDSITIWALIHVNGHPVRPVAPYCQTKPNTVKTWKSQETAIAPNLTMGQCDMLLRTSSFMPGKGGIGICNGMSYQDGWVNLFPWARGNYSISTGIHCPAVSWTCWNVLYLEWNMRHWKRGEGGGLGLAYPVSSPSFHNVHANMYVQSGQVPKAADLPFLKARWARSVFYWYNHLTTVFVPPLAWKTEHP